MSKIMFIHHSGLIGGAGMSLYHVINMLSEKHKVAVYCPSKPADMTRFLREKGINVKNYHMPLGSISYYMGGPRILSRTFVSGLIKIFTHNKEWIELIKVEKPDIVVVNSMILCWMGRVINKAGTKSVCFVRETFRRGTFGLISGVIKRLLNTFNGVFFISEYDMKQANCKAPVFGVVHNCINFKDYIGKISREEACYKLGIKPDTFNVLYVGGLNVRIKGADILIKALNRIKNRNIRIIVAGYVPGVENGLKKWVRSLLGGDYPQKIQRLIAENRLDSKISFIGIQKNMPIVYAASDVLVFPSTEPHQARPAFEAGAAHIPVIISDFEQTAEYVQDGINGLTFRPGDDKELANAIERLYNDRELLKHLGENNYRHTAETHEISKVKRVLWDYIDKVLNT